MGNISAPLGRGSIYTAPFSSVVISTAGSWDLLTLTAPSNSRVAILEIRLGQYTQFGDAKAGVQSLQIMTGSTATSTGAAITPLNVDGHTGASTGKTVGVGTDDGHSLDRILRCSPRRRLERCGRLVLQPAQLRAADGDHPQNQRDDEPPHADPERSPDDECDDHVSRDWPLAPTRRCRITQGDEHYV